MMLGKESCNTIQDVAKKIQPKGLLRVRIEKFYGSSSARVSLKKKAENDYGVNTGMKGADAILRIAIGILMKTKTRVEMEAYYDPNERQTR